MNGIIGQEINTFILLFFQGAICDCDTMAAGVGKVYCFDAIANNDDGDNLDDIDDGGITERRRRKAPLRRWRRRADGDLMD